MEYLSMNQHDKWGRFGLWQHLGTDPYTSRIAWLKIWWCNRNPRLLINYYLEAGRCIGGMSVTSLFYFDFHLPSSLDIPLITMSDRGCENNGIANFHTTIQHQLDPSLHNTLQHRWCIDKTNIKAEAMWSQLCSQWSPGFEDVLDFGINAAII